jgi:hypothetical protein
VPFEFAYSFRCVSLGRDDGLIQFVDAQDRPVEEVWTGARGARWKEYICRRPLNGVGFDDDLGPPPDTPSNVLPTQAARPLGSAIQVFQHLARQRHGDAAFGCERRIVQSLHEQPGGGKRPVHTI